MRQFSSPAVNNVIDCMSCPSWQRALLVSGREDERWGEKRIRLIVIQHPLSFKGFYTHSISMKSYKLLARKKKV
jgi:hypothetical protein